MTHSNAAAYLHQSLRQKLSRQQKFVRDALKSAAGLPGAPKPEENGAVRVTETRIYIGLNDGETKKQEYETGHYLDILKEVCRENRVAFSVDIEEGGYYHEDGTYTEETSLVLLLIDADPDKVQTIANEMCARFHQESVLVTEDRIDGRFVEGKL